MSNLRVLYIASEITPFLDMCGVGEHLRPLPEGMQNKGLEIRIIVPRFGVINERKNRLHEVVRLSGINISIGEEEKPLIIKVASIPQAKMQVYFIDNEDYYQRKRLFTDDAEQPFEDNDERAIFFCKGALETVKKLGWSPDIVHCHDWFAGAVPMYLRSSYKNHPIFKETKIIYTAYDNLFAQTFDKTTLLDKLAWDDLDQNLAEPLIANPTPAGFVGVGASLADFVVKAQPSQDLDNALQSIAQDKVLSANSEEESICDFYHQLYQELVGEAKMV
ncbi:glycogen/starch synthase [Hugenholtzia roseola]|uniref:glycogen/starch synthase n=1 Tax=Hugenholtzia roseola TaxID=1002 RepID=UPI00041CC40D|nr:glycogen/starch synthase [Hugenholtzia roseola]